MSTENTNDQIEQPAITFTPEPGSGFVAPVEENETQEEQSNNAPPAVDSQEEWQDVGLDDLPDFEDEENIFVEANEDIAFRILKDKRGLEVEKFDDLLTPKEQKKYAPQ